VTLGGAYRTLKTLWEQGPKKAAVNPFMQRTILRSLTGATQVDPMQQSYFHARDDANAWLSQQGIERAPLDPGEGDRALAMYHLKQAIRESNAEDQMHWLTEFAAHGGTAKSLAVSLANMDPLRFVPKGDQEAYVKQLKPDEAMRLRRAYLHWQRVTEPDLNIGDSWKDPDVWSFVRSIKRDMTRAIQRDPLVTGHELPDEIREKLRKNFVEKKRGMRPETTLGETDQPSAEDLQSALGISPALTGAKGNR
jgi:hypothetical protein